MCENRVPSRPRLHGPGPDWHCNSKRAFATFEEACRAAKLSRRREKSTMSPYKCKRCRQWHIGHGRRNYRTPPKGAA